MPKSKSSPMRFFSKYSIVSDWLPQQTRTLTNLTNHRRHPRVRLGIRGNGIGLPTYAGGGDLWCSHRRTVWTYDLSTLLTDRLVSGKRLWTVGQPYPSLCGTRLKAPDEDDPSFLKMKVTPPSPSGIPIAYVKLTSPSQTHCCQNRGRKF